jgi:hypothetical protein
LNKEKSPFDIFYRGGSVLFKADMDGVKLAASAAPPRRGPI